MMRPVGVAIAACLMTTEVMAGAWTLPAGDGQLIMTTLRRAAPVSALFGGVPEEDSNGTQIFVEYGLTDDLTLGGTAFADFSATDVEVEASLGIHARYRLWSGDGGVASVQAGLSVPVERWFGNGLGDNVPNSVTEVDIRALFGQSWQTDFGNTFVSAEGGFRFRGESQSEELRFDVTAGHEAFRGILGLFSVFASYPVGDDGEATFKLSPSIAYTDWPWLGSNDKKPYDFPYPDTIQIGVTWDAANPDAGLEIGFSIWRRF